MSNAADQRTPSCIAAQCAEPVYTVGLCRACWDQLLSEHRRAIMASAYRLSKPPTTRREQELRLDVVTGCIYLAELRDTDAEPLRRERRALLRTLGI